MRIWVALLLLGIPASLAGEVDEVDRPPKTVPAGTAELVLDRTAATVWLGSLLPATIELPLPGGKRRIVQPRLAEPVHFFEGGLEGVLQLDGTGIDTTLRFRAVPTFEPRYGELRLHVERATLELAGRAAVDIADSWPDLTLPRRGDLSLGETAFGASIRGIRIEPDHLTLELGFAAEPPAR